MKRRLYGLAVVVLVASACDAVEQTNKDDAKISASKPKTERMSEVSVHRKPTGLYMQIIDPASFRLIDGMKQGLVNFAAIEKDGDRFKQTSLIAFDCTRERMKTLSENIKNEKDETVEHKDAGDYAYPLPGTIGRKTMDIVCQGARGDRQVPSRNQEVVLGEFLAVKPK